MRTAVLAMATTMAGAVGCSYDWSRYERTDGAIHSDPDGRPSADGVVAPFPGCVRFVRPGPGLPEPDGLTWSTAFNDPAEAAGAASEASGTFGKCEIWVARGTYYVYSTEPSDTVLLRPGVELYGGFDTTETSRAQRDWTANPTILDGHKGPAGDHHVFHVVTGSDDSVLDGFVVTGGRAQGDTDRDRCGGGMLNHHASPTVRNCTFDDNSATQAGGGICNIGGAPEIAGCTFRMNSADYGGGMRNRDTAATVAGCRFIENGARNGGGVHNFDAVLTVFNTVFSGNWAEDKGGAMRNNNGSDVVLVNNTFSGNEAGDESGSIHNGSESRVDVVNAILWGNHANGSPDEIQPGNHVSVRYSDIRGGFEGEGNIDADPRFHDSASGNFRLKPDSPCIDAADGQAAPDTDLDGNPRVDHPYVANSGAGGMPFADMGAYEAMP